MRALIEGDLLALEVAEATTVGRGLIASAVTSTTTSATTATAVESTTATTAATTTAEASASTASTTTAETTTTTARRIVVFGPRSSEVETDCSATNVGAVESFDSSSSLFDRAESNVSEALQLSRLAVSWERDTGDGSELLEHLGDLIIVGLEGKVTEEYGVTGVALLVTKLVGAVVGEGVAIALRTRLAEVDVQGAATNLSTLLACVGSDSTVEIGEFNIAEAAK
jgi:hypothetical protein